MREFDHERMKVYQIALEFLQSAASIRRSFPAGRRALADQLDRASLSIALNIAEGAGEFAQKEKARFYRIARRSATECAAILDIVHKLRLCESKDLGQAKDQVRSIVAMLVNLGKSIESR